MQLNWLDRIVAAVAPEKGVRRAVARNAMAYYEAARETRFRKFHRDGGHPDTLVRTSAVELRNQARYLERNHDLARGILRTMVNNLVGPNGIGIEPQPRRADNTIHEQYAADLRRAWLDFGHRPEVTWRLSWAKMQRQVARTWLRDGEAFAQILSGPVQYLDHGTRVPLSLEAFEPDMIPLDYDNATARIRQGVQLNAWGRATGYYASKTHPQDSYGMGGGNYKHIGAASMLHVFNCDRLHQVRGVTEFASVLGRIEDIKDYEESERVAAKLAARLTMYIRRGAAENYDPDLDPREKDADGNPMPRELGLEAGTILDNLGQGEEVGLIDTKRPNLNAIQWRQGQLRAVAAGIGASYSSIARDYNGTYSAQRQELVEQWVNYAVLTDDFTGMFVRPVWEQFVAIANLSGVVPTPKDVKPDTANDAMYVGQSMPWIDPLREAEGWTALVQSGFASEVEVHRRRGVNPRDVLEQIAAWRLETAAANVTMTSNPATPGTAPATPQKSAGADKTVPDDAPSSNKPKQEPAP